MISKEELESRGFIEVEKNTYSYKIEINIGIVNSQPVNRDIHLIIEVSEEENELGIFIVQKFNNSIIHTGYYTDIDDFLSDIKI